MQDIIFKDIGLIDFKVAWDYQEQLLNEIVKIKVTNRNNQNNEQRTPNYLLFCEHPHVYTLGKSGSVNNLLIDENTLIENEATFYKINRGGDITYHGPGQIVGYPILNLDYFFNDIHQYLRYLEETIIRTLAEYNIKASRIENLTGVWLDAEDKNKARKICAFGVRCSRWVTMHGFAFNVNTDLDYFKNIIPCGITNKAVTSLKKELGTAVDINEVKKKIKKHFAELFKASFVNKKTTLKA